MSAAVPAVAGISLGRGHRETFSRAYDRFDGPRTGRPSPAVPVTVPFGHLVDITA